MTANSKERPYKPSWVDGFTDWVETLPIRGWIFYAGTGLGLILIQVLFLWLDGGLAKAEVLLPIIIFNAFLTPFGLALMHLLDYQATAAINSMRPALVMTELEFDEFQYKLSNMPSRVALVVALVTLASLILSEQLQGVPIRFAALEQLPIFAVVFHVIDKAPALVFGVFVYHSIRQLRLVNTINSNYVRVSLYRPGPFQAFSRLTASTAVGLVVGVYGWMLINPELLANPMSLGAVGALTILAVAVFVWPLYGAHRLMQEEKERALHKIDLCFEAVFSEFNQRIHDDDYAATERLNGTITSLEIQHNRVSAIPTWPWRSETARVALTAIALPLLLMIIQFFILQALDG
ncbi:hypothetical protein ACFLT5_00400 [Chloroflexota bacterium]